jgi:preprotein translocase subunit SecG
MNWNKLKLFVVLLLTRWLLKAVGGIFVGMGLQGGGATEFLTQISTMIVGGIFFLIGIAISWVQNKYLARMEPGNLIADNMLHCN